MQLKEIRNLLVLFLKQFNKDDVNLLLNYLPIFLEDIQRDPLLLDKIPDPSSYFINSVKNEHENEPRSNEGDNNNSDNSTNNLVKLIPTLIENHSQISNSTDNNNMLAYESYDEEDSEETNQSNHFTDMNSLIPSRYSNQVVDYLYKMYETNKYPKSDQLYKMSLEINLTPKQIQTWFSNTRFKLKHSKSHMSPKGSLLENSNDDLEIKDEESNSNFLSIDENETAKTSNESDSNSRSNDCSNITSSNPQSNESYEYDEVDDISDELSQSILSRTRLPVHILEYLIKMYKINKYPNTDEVYQMSKETNLATKKIKNWFDSTRFKLKHSKKTFHMSKQNVNYLIEKFDSNNSPTSNEIEEMALQTGLNESQIYQWFYQRRRLIK